MKDENKISVVGGGLAGCEAAYQISKLGIDVDLYEMRPNTKTEAHNTEYLAELVCSNSFRSDDKEYNAVGVLHEELRMSDSLIMKTADLNKVPAGSALAATTEAGSIHNRASCNLNHLQLRTHFSASSKVNRSQPKLNVMPSMRPSALRGRGTR